MSRPPPLSHRLRAAGHSGGSYCFVAAPPNRVADLSGATFARALPRHACRQQCCHVAILAHAAAVPPSRRGYFRYWMYRSCIRPADWLRPTVS
jgi:hypothetical protein